MYEELLTQAVITLDIFLFFSKLVCHLQGGESGSQIPVRQSLHCNQSDTELSITTTRALPENTLLPSLPRKHSLTHSHTHTHTHTLSLSLSLSLSIRGLDEKKYCTYSFTLVNKKNCSFSLCLFFSFFSSFFKFLMSTFFPFQIQPNKITV